MQDEICRTYSDTPPERIPLSAQKEFKAVRNMVIREAVKLTEPALATASEEESNEAASEQERMEGDAVSSASPTMTDEESHKSRKPRHSDRAAPDVGAAVVRMLHHMGNIFQEQTSTDGFRRGFQIDRKRRQQLRDKRLAMGHREDDREEETTVQQQTM